MKLIYFGTASFAVPALKRLAEHVSNVITQPDKPSGRGMQVHSSPVKTAALELGLPVQSPISARDPEFIEWVRQQSADALVVAAYGQILPVALLESARQGAFNLHGSVLPHYRGAAPIQRAVMDGLMETGVTLIQMDKGMDSGDVVAIEKLAVGADETYGELQDRLAELAAIMAGEWMPKIARGEYPRTPQDHAQMTLAPKISVDDATLSTDRSAAQEYNRFRAVTPAPGARIHTKWGQVKILECRIAESCLAPGTLEKLGGDWILGFTGGGIALKTVKPEGKRAMPFADAANGWRAVSGESILA